MTTPEVEIVMPYGVVVEGDGESKNGNLITESEYAPVRNLRLPAGPSNVHFSWDGPDEVHLMMYVPGVGVKTKGIIPSGGGVRSLMVPIGSDGKDSVYLEGTKPLSKGARGTLSVYPLVFEI